MQVLVVLHAKNPDFVGKVPDSLAGFDMAAVFEGIALDEAYERTNTISAPWFKAPTKVTDSTPLVWAKGPSRSTSVGDVILAITADGTKGFVVASIGFTEFDASGMVVGGPNKVPPATLNG